MLKGLQIVVLLLLFGECAWATTWYVYPEDTVPPASQAPQSDAASIQAALDKAAPGDTIELAPGRYFEDFHSVRDGTSDKPITIHGTRASIVQGSGHRSHIIDINHDYIHLVGFTVDGLTGTPTVKHNYIDKLIYVHGRRPNRGLTGLLIDSLALRNAGGECLRLRYFVNHSEIRNTLIAHCGVHDFRFTSAKKNGEGIYLGTSSTQWSDGKNPTADPDRSSHNWIHDNEFHTWGDECVDIKEGAEHNLVEHNICEHQQDAKSAGFDARGDDNVFRYNIVRDNVGSAFRLGGHRVDGRQYGIGNQVYGNTIGYNGAGAVKIMAKPQGRICDNLLQQANIIPVRGEGTTRIHPEARCPQG